MAGSSEDRWRRPSHGDQRDDEPEEGELVPGYHSDVDTEEYYNRHCSLSDDSDETISDSNAACSVVPACDATSSLPVAANSPNNGGEARSSSVAAPAVLPCPVCGKVFRSQKAVCGHMKVHAHGLIGRQQEQGSGKGKAGIKRDVAAAAFVGAWGGTGKRGCPGLGGTAASPNAEPEQSTMAIVVAEPNIVLQPMPLAFAPPNLSTVPMSPATPIHLSTPMASAAPDLSSVAVATINVSGQSTSAQPMPDDAMDTVVAGPAHDAVVHPQAAPPPLARRGRQNPNGYPCDQCDLRFSTHQALGGHKAGHKSREVAAAAAAAAGALEDGGAAPCGRNARPPEKAHVCKVCGAVFPAGVQLGGHMRKHYTGPPIVPNKKPRLSFQQPILPPPVLTLAPLVNADGASPAPAVEAAAPQPGPAPEVEMRTPEPASRPAVPSRVLLFGIDIGVGAQQKPAAQEGPSDATEGSASSGGGEQ